MQIDGKQFWKEFTDITTNRPSPTDLKTRIFYRDHKTYLEVCWDERSLGGIRLLNKWFEKRGINRLHMIVWLESQGVRDLKRK